MKSKFAWLLALAAASACAQDAQVHSTQTYTLRPENAGFSEQLMPELRLPEGFAIDVYARPGGNARMLAVDAAGNVYLTRREEGDVLRFRDTDGDGIADEQAAIVPDLEGAHGITIDGDTMYLATVREVLRMPVPSGDGPAEPRVIIDDLPDGGQHPNRTLAVHGGKLWITVGSSCNACAETNPEHATILTADLDGTNREVFASGLRNTIGFDWHPVTDELWGMDHGSDDRGNNLPPEELNHLRAGKDYGWPYAFGKRIVDPIMKDPPGTTKREYAEGTEPSVLEYQAHSAPLGMAFYDPPADAAHAFPGDYRGDAFVAFRGSWNRRPATGYKVVRIVFDDAGRPQRFEDFVTGFLLPDGQTHFARLAGLAVHPDGSLLFTDDANGVIYRVAPTR